MLRAVTRRQCVETLSSVHFLLACFSRIATPSGKGCFRVVSQGYQCHHSVTGGQAAPSLSFWECRHTSGGDRARRLLRGEARAVYRYRCLRSGCTWRCVAATFDSEHVYAMHIVDEASR